MKYMLLIYEAENDSGKDGSGEDGLSKAGDTEHRVAENSGTENRGTENERTESMLRSLSVSEELGLQGKWIDSARLHPATSATSLRIRDGQRHITEGPFTKTTEPLAGYHIIDVASRDEAIEIASRLPDARTGTIEIRPLLPLPDALSLPGGDTHQRPSTSPEKPKDYILLMYAEAGVWPPEEHAAALEESVQVCHQLHANGQFLSAAPLQPPETAACVRIRNGSRAVVDGPFTETKEQLGGYFRIRVATLDEAITVAARIPGSRRGTAEIRSLSPLPERTALPTTAKIAVASESE